MSDDWPDGWYRPDTGQPGASQGSYAAPGSRPGVARRMARAAARARGTGRARTGAPRAGPAGNRAAAEILGPAGPPRAADRADRGPGRGGPAGGPGRLYVYLDGKLNRSVALPAFAGQSAGQNWLIAGSDSRQGLSQQQIDNLHVG